MPAYRVTNCLFFGNVASSAGGGMFTEFPLTLTNCSFVGNASAQGGGIYNYATATVANCILWQDGATTGSEIANSLYAKPTYSHCDIQGSGGSASWHGALGSDQGGNIDGNPLFANAALPIGPDGIWGTRDDGLQLQSTSPCIHTGNPVGAPLTDILGHPRQGQPDMGAYQFIPPPKAFAKGWGYYY